MNFKIENDLENNLMLLTVTTKLRERLNQPRVTCGWPTARLLVTENYECPKTHTLGKCINPYQAIDNDDPAACKMIWKFKLVPVVKEVKKSTTPRRSRTKKTTTKKSKND